MSVQSSLNIRICKSVAEAPSFRMPEYKTIRIEQVNIVREGTEEGRSTVDLVLQDESGQKYVTMLTGRIIRSLAVMIGEEG